MAYQIDFTAREYAIRSRRKLALRLLLAAAIAGTVWEIHDAYVTYNEPTLNMRLQAYASAARPVEEMSAAWDAAEKEYKALSHYYRLVWAANPTNFLGAMAAADAPRLGHAFRPIAWELKTGGDCRLDYAFAFDAGDKAEQAKGLEDRIVRAVTSVVQVVEGKVDVAGVAHENLLNVGGFNVSATFRLPDVKAFPAKEPTLAKCIEDIAAFRKRVQEEKLADPGDTKGGPTTAQGIMMKYLAVGMKEPDFPDWKNVIDIAGSDGKSGWFGNADRFIMRHRIPGDDKERQQLKVLWNKIGDARFPWQRDRALDNPALVESIKVLGLVADGVRPFKVSLEKDHENCRNRLEPFTNAYDRVDVFNKPYVTRDLRVAAAGIGGVGASFKEEAGAEPAILERADEQYTFTWIRWTLTVGAGKEAIEPITLEKLTECIRRVLALGPGYALESVKVTFDGAGKVAGAELTGLLPVKTRKDL